MNDALVIHCSPRFLQNAVKMFSLPIAKIGCVNRTYRVQNCCRIIEVFRMQGNQNTKKFFLVPCRFLCYSRCNENIQFFTHFFVYFTDIASYPLTVNTGIPLPLLSFINRKTACIRFCARGGTDG